MALVGTDALRDSSSAAIAVCGLLELVKHLPATDPDRERYLEWAKGIMSSLTKHYLIGKDEKGNGLLKHSVYHLASDKGVDECASWGGLFLRRGASAVHAKLEIVLVITLTLPLFP